MLTINYENLKLNNNHHLLDLGCGEGRHILGALHYSGNRCTGLDVCSKSLKKAEEKRHDSFPELPVEWVKGNGEALPFENNTFDRIICSEVLEHIIDYKLVLTEIFRVLKPKGIIGISVPRFLPERICWLFSKDYHNTPGGHVRIFKQKTLKQAILESGFHFINHHFAHAFHAPYWWLQCFLWKSRETSWLVKRYENWLVKDMFSFPYSTNPTEKKLNPYLGKSVVMYFQKP